MEVLARVFALSLGGVLGVNARYWLGVLMSRWAAAPWATFTANISGAFAIGVVSVALTHWLPHPHARIMIVTGFLGGYTTFSTLAFESAVFWERGDLTLAFANLAGSLVAGLIAVLLGMILARDLIVPTGGIPLGRESHVQAAQPPPDSVPTVATEGRLEEEAP